MVYRANKKWYDCMWVQHLFFWNLIRCQICILIYTEISYLKRIPYVSLFRIRLSTPTAWIDAGFFSPPSFLQLYKIANSGTFTQACQMYACILQCTFSLMPTSHSRLRQRVSKSTIFSFYLKFSRAVNLGVKGTICKAWLGTAIIDWNVCLSLQSMMKVEHVAYE